MAMFTNVGGAATWPDRPAAASPGEKSHQEAVEGFKTERLAPPKAAAQA